MNSGEVAPQRPAAAPAFSLAHLFVGSGAQIVAQGIALLSMTVVARLYSPAELGLFTLFSTLMMFLAPLGSLTLSNAILFATRRGEMFSLGQASLLGTLAVSLLVVVLGSVLSATVSAELLWWMPLLLAFALITKALSFWASQSAIWFARIPLEARAAILAAVATAMIRILGGAIEADAFWLMLAAGVGPALLALVVWQNAFGGLSLRRVFRFDRNRLLAATSQHADFPRYTMPAIAIRYGALALAPWFLSERFGLAVSGQYGLAFTIMMMPLALLTIAVSRIMTRPIVSVFDANRSDGVRMVLRASGGFGIVSTLAAAVLFFTVNHIIPIIFGSGWDQAGRFVICLLPWMIMMFIELPMLILVPRLKLQSHAARLEMTFALIRILVLLAGARFAGPIGAVLGFALAGAIQSFIMTTITVHRARSNRASSA
ncbi:hypothetical protein WJS89_02885 [Sphingomicrobium sp. XHP0235]|uniref:lipopolysaccharide biosynthesis protein n=1 Tax=Sphingomicrobium aquimarinum TaxID=3133971 RepID=UPI0031FF3C4B